MEQNSEATWIRKPLGLSKTRFAERVFHFAKSDVSQLGNLLFWNSGIMIKQQEKIMKIEQDFVKMRFWHEFGMAICLRAERDFRTS